jgi:hypothetical protein
MHGLSICLIAKNEARYIREWLEYHLMIGVEHFHIYNNGSEDDISGAIQDYSRYITLIEWPHRGNQQKLAYQHYLREYASASKWTAFIDADEFLCYSGKESLYDFLAASSSSVAGFQVPWVIYGTNGHLTRPPGLVIENYTRAHSVSPQKNVKTICQGRLVDYAEIDSPHRFPYLGNRKAVDTDKDLLCVCHFMLRSRQDIHEKVARGDAWSVTTEAKRLANIPGAVQSILDKYDSPDIVDMRMLKYLPELKRRLSSRCG